VSVRLSVTLVDCIQTAEDLVKLLPQPDSRIILVVQPRVPIPNSKGHPFSGRQIQGWENFAIFNWNCRLSRKRYEIVPGCYGTSIGSHMRYIEERQFQWPWRTPIPVFKVTAFLKLNISKTLS